MTGRDVPAVDNGSVLAGNKRKKMHYHSQALHPALYPPEGMLVEAVATTLIQHFQNRVQKCSTAYQLATAIHTFQPVVQTRFDVADRERILSLDVIHFVIDVFSGIHAFASLRLVTFPSRKSLEPLGGAKPPVCLRLKARFEWRGKCNTLFTDRSLPRGQPFFFLDEKEGKKSRKNDASPLEADAWPAVLSGLRSLGNKKGVGVVGW